jgi:hypothetical protein
LVNLRRKPHQCDWGNGALRDLGLVAGQDVAVIGFNDIDIAAELPIP